MVPSSPRRVRRRALVLRLLLGFLGFLGAGSTSCERGALPAAPAERGPERTVRLPDGSSVRLFSRALRVFAASSSVVDFLVAIAPPERIAALPEQALDYASVPGDGAESDAWRAVPRFSAYVAETVIALAPDLAIVEPSQDRNTSERLRSAGLEVVTLPEVRTWPEARATLLCVGELLGLQERANAVVRDLDLRVERLAALPGARRGLRVACYSNFGSAGWSAGSATTLHEQIVLAGMRNAVAELGRVGHVQFTFEELIALDPDLILVSEPLHGAAGTQGDRGGASQRVLESEPCLQGLRAVQSGRILALPPNLYATSSHTLVRGAEELARLVEARLAGEGEPESRAGARGERKQ